MIIFVPSPSPSWPPSNADNIFRFEVEVDDAKRVEVSHTLAHLNGDHRNCGDRRHHGFCGERGDQGYLGDRGEYCDFLIG